MKKAAIFTIVILSVFLFASNSSAQSKGNGNHGAVKTNWVDLNGDGICDNAGTPAQGAGKVGNGYGKKDGTGNPIRPMDGTGYGKKAGSMNGTCTGTGTQGTSGRGYRGGK